MFQGNYARSATHVWALRILNNEVITTAAEKFPKLEQSFSFLFNFYIQQLMNGSN